MAANFAVAALAACPGHRISLLSRVGDDAFGVAVLSGLQSSGVDTTGVAIEPGGFTWWCAVALDQSGEKALLGGRTSASLPAGPDIDHRRIAGARWVHVLADVPEAADALAAAGAAGAIRSVDIEAGFASTAHERAMSLVTMSDLVVTNSAGLRALTGIDEPAVAARQLAGRTKVVLVTLGRQGSLLGTAGETLFGPVPAVRRVVDTTGAGDSFAGAFVARTLAGDSPQQALSAATRSATSTVEHLGARAQSLSLSPSTAVSKEKSS